MRCVNSDPFDSKAESINLIYYKADESARLWISIARYCNAHAPKGGTGEEEKYFTHDATIIVAYLLWLRLQLR